MDNYIVRKISKRKGKKYYHKYYDKNGNLELSTGPYKWLNIDNNTNLESGTVYYAKSINNRTIELF